MDSISDNTLNTQPAQWNGLTMDELRMRRAKMLVRREESNTDAPVGD